MCHDKILSRKHLHLSQVSGCSSFRNPNSSYVLIQVRFVVNKIIVSVTGNNSTSFPLNGATQTPNICKYLIRYLTSCQLRQKLWCVLFWDRDVQCSDVQSCLHQPHLLREYLPNSNLFIYLKKKSQSPRGYFLHKPINLHTETRSCRGGYVS